MRLACSAMLLVACGGGPGSGSTDATDADEAQRWSWSDEGFEMPAWDIVGGLIDLDDEGCLAASQPGADTLAKVTIIRFDEPSPAPVSQLELGFRAFVPRDDMGQLVLMTSHDPIGDVNRQGGCRWSRCPAPPTRPPPPTHKPS